MSWGTGGSGWEYPLWKQLHCFLLERPLRNFLFLRNVAKNWFVFIFPWVLFPQYILLSLIQKSFGTKYDSIIYMDPFAKYDTVKGKVHPIGRIRVRTYDDFAQDFDRARAEAPEAERICRATTNNDPRCHSKNSICTQLIHF